MSLSWYEWVYFHYYVKRYIIYCVILEFFYHLFDNIRRRIRVLEIYTSGRHYGWRPFWIVNVWRVSYCKFTRCRVQYLQVLLHLAIILCIYYYWLIYFYRAYRDGTGKNRSLWEATRPLASPFLFFIMTSIWVLASPTNILERDPRCFTFLVGVVFSNICCQLIVAQMSNTRCELLSWLLAPVAAVVALALLLPSHIQLELPLLYILTAFTLLAHIHYGVCLVSCFVFGFF